MLKTLTKWLSKKGYAQGIFFLFIMMFVSGINDVITKAVGQRLPPMEIMFFRFFFTLITLVPFIFKLGNSVFRTKMLSLNILRGILGFAGFSAFIYSVIHLKLVEVVTIFWTIPLFILVLSKIFLHEAVSLNRWLATIIGFAGLTSISIFSSTELSAEISFNYLYLIPIASAFVFSIQDIMIKKMIISEHPITMMFYFSIITTILCLPFALYVWETPTSYELAGLFFLGIGGNAMQYFIFKAFSATDVSALAPFRYVEFLISALFGIIFFREFPGTNVIVGATILIPSTLYLVYSEKVKGPVTTIEQ